MKIDNFVLNQIRTSNLIYIYLYHPEWLGQYLKKITGENK